MNPAFSPTIHPSRTLMTDISALVRDLVVANRILARENVVDAYGHVSVRHPDDPRPLIAEGIWRGEIARAPRGANGFGYDPLFLLPERGKTAAELDPAEKNRISHRGVALQRLLVLLNESDRR